MSFFAKFKIFILIVPPSMKSPNSQPQHHSIELNHSQTHLSKKKNSSKIKNSEKSLKPREALRKDET